MNAARFVFLPKLLMLSVVAGIPAFCLAQEGRGIEKELKFRDFGVRTMRLGNPREIRVVTFDVQVDFDEIHNANIDAAIIEMHLMQRVSTKTGKIRYVAMEDRLKKQLEMQFELFVVRMEGELQAGNELISEEHLRILKSSKKEFLNARMEVVSDLIQDGEVSEMVAASFDQLCHRIGIEVSDTSRIQGLLKNRQLNKTHTTNDWRPPGKGGRHLRLRGDWAAPQPDDH